LPSKSNAEDTLYVLMGASNLARGQYALVQALEKFGSVSRNDILVALGPGRGYCARGGFLNVRYDPVHDCGILSAAEARAKTTGIQTVALFMDIGNDIMYGFSGEEILTRLNAMVDRLKLLKARVWVTPIPVDMENDVDEKTFNILRNLFFPNSSISYDQARRAVLLINGELKNLSGERLSLIPDLNKFCGMDKIHYHLWKSNHVWTLIAQCLLGEGGAAVRVGKIDSGISLGYNLLQRCLCDILGVKENPRNSF